LKIGKIDLAQIECRILNTVAGQWDVVEQFRQGVDLYSVLATRFYGFPVDKSMPAERGTGKQLELSCGYGAGGPTIVRTARAGTYGPPVHLTAEQGMQARDLYRETHPAVVKLWDCGGRFLWHLLDGSTVNWPGCPVTAHDHRLFGPGGLWLDFTSLERHTVEETGEIIWRHRVKNGWRKTYGARLIENMIQWLASYPIRYGLVRIDRELGLKPLLTVHDDIFLPIPVERVDLFEAAVKIMSEPLPWLPDCPIAVEAKLMDALDE
jgi:hypothetical protein